MPGLQGLEFWSHIYYEEEIRPTGRLTTEQIRQVLHAPQKVSKKGFKKATVAKVRLDVGFPVASFRDLVRCVAELGSRNSRFNLFFRGQSEDDLDWNGKTRLYPSIFRPEKGKKSLHKLVRECRFELLRNLVKKLRIYRARLGLSSSLGIHPEYWYSILQHYQLCRTPLLDLTQSLRVAATFALLNTQTGILRSKGYVYVLGMPHLHGCISAFVDYSMTVVKLQNICPPDALRPHFQEGYLVGRWPRTLSKEAEDNFAYWLVGKYLLDNNEQSFFDTQFPPLPAEALLPETDKFRDQLQELLDQSGHARASGK
jgi:hypothetical protein